MAMPVILHPPGFLSTFPGKRSSYISSYSPAHFSRKHLEQVLGTSSSLHLGPRYGAFLAHSSSQRTFKIRAAQDLDNVSDGDESSSEEGESKSPGRRKRSRKATPDSSDDEGGKETRSTASKASKKPSSSKKSSVKRQTGDSIKDGEKLGIERDQVLNEDKSSEEVKDEDEEEEEIYDWPPLVCCFGEALNEFIPTVRVCVKQMDPDIYSTWKGLQWTPPEFARAPGTTAANVALSHVRLGGRAAFMGKVGGDEVGQQIVKTLNENRVQTRGVKFDPKLPTAKSRLKLHYGNGHVSASCMQQSAENSLKPSEINKDILKEARMFHFSSLSLTTESATSSLLQALKISKSFGATAFFDLNLPLPLWTDVDKTWSMLQTVWKSSDVIEMSKVELEFLLRDEGMAIRKLTSNLFARSLEEFRARKNKRYEYHYTPEDIAPLWHDGLRLLFVTDATHKIHYYTPNFHGYVVGTEDVIIAAQTCDRTGSGDAIVAGMMRKLVTQPELYTDEDKLQRALRFVISAGIISQWTTGAVRGFPTESAAQNLTEQVFPLTLV